MTTFPGRVMSISAPLGPVGGHQGPRRAPLPRKAPVWPPSGGEPQPPPGLQGVLGLPACEVDAGPRLPTTGPLTCRGVAGTGVSAASSVPGRGALRWGHPQ